MSIIENVWALWEENLSVIPLGSPNEAPPNWLVERHGDVEEARLAWPKTPRYKWAEFQDKQPSQEELELWISMHPATNWAVLTGQQITVVDADSDDAVEFVETGRITRTPRWVDTSAGRHYWFRASSGLAIRNSANHGLDIRGIGGYVVAPGSQHSDGTIYTQHIAAGLDGSISELPVLTEHDMTAITGFGTSSSVSGVLPDITGIAPIDPNVPVEAGARDATAASLAGKLIGQGQDLNSVVRQLHAWNEDNPEPLAPGLIDKTIASVTGTHQRNHPEEPILITPPVEQVYFRQANELINSAGATSWLVRNYLTTDSLALLFGDFATGKSFIALDLACSIALGVPWLDQKTQLGSVFFICGEGQLGIGKRLRAWQQHHESLADAPLFISTIAPNLNHEATAIAVMNTIQQLADASGTVPRMIVVDTVARTLAAGGEDENETKAMSRFVNLLDHYCRRPWGACVLCVHHVGHGDKSRARGSIALPAACDIAFHVERHESGPLTLSCTKMKDDVQPDELNLELLVVELDDLVDDEGAPVTSAVIIPSVSAPGAKPVRGKYQQDALAVLGILYEQGRTRVVERGGSSHEAVVMLIDWRAELLAHWDVSNKVMRRRFSEVRAALVKADAIRIDEPHVYLL